MDPSCLDPEIAAALDLGPHLPPMSTATLSEHRESMRMDAVALSERVLRTEHLTAPNGPIMRIHTPTDVDGPLPCLYWMHGGGLVMGDRFMDDQRFDVWCARHSMIAAVVEYRLAPEHPYPAAVEDCAAGLAWLVAHADELGMDRDRIGVGGASAGGGLAAALALVNRDRMLTHLHFQLLVYPMLDDRPTESSTRPDLVRWPNGSNRYAWQNYLAGHTPGPDGHASPARADDLRGLPRTYICVGTHDGFLDEDVEYARRLVHADVPVDLRIHAGLPHGYDSIAPRAAAVRRANRDLNEWLALAVQR